jgi:drug/metabolite transporter (DMT)-like permease
MQSNTNYANMKQSSTIDGEAPSKIYIYSALISAQVIFGISAVVGTIGLPSFHPLTFALVRESNATLLLLLAAHVVSIYSGREGGLLSGSLKDWKLIFVSGLGIFMSQAFYIVGIKLSNAVAASVWQPSQPILTAAVCMMMGWEQFNFHRVLGILVAFLGCAIMVMGGGAATGESLGGGGDEFTSGFSDLMGQISFLINCLGSSLYVLASKRVLATGRYESVTVTAWSYLTATFMMAVFGILMSWSEPMSLFLCSDCEGSVWRVPPSAIPALIWYIIMTSSTAYGLITWANKYATGTLVIGYTVLQPMASAVLIQTLISFGIFQSCSVAAEGSRSLLLGRIMDELVRPCLDEPDRYTAFGAVGVVTGK